MNSAKSVFDWYRKALELLMLRVTVIVKKYLYLFL